MSHTIPGLIQGQVDLRDGLIDRMTGRHIGLGRNLHHRKLLSRGGLDTPGNIVTLSGSGTTGTHGWAHANPDEATRAGFMVPSWIDEPAKVPIKLHDARGRIAWWLLTDEGKLRALTDAEAGDIMRALGIWKDTPLF